MPLPGNDSPCLLLETAPALLAVLLLCCFAGNAGAQEAVQVPSECRYAVADPEDFLKKHPNAFAEVHNRYLLQLEPYLTGAQAETAAAWKKALTNSKNVIRGAYEHTAHRAQSLCKTLREGALKPEQQKLAASPAANLDDKDCKLLETAAKSYMPAATEIARKMGRIHEQTMRISDVMRTFHNAAIDVLEGASHLPQLKGAPGAPAVPGINVRALKKEMETVLGNEPKNENPVVMKTEPPTEANLQIPRGSLFAPIQHEAMKQYQQLKEPLKKLSDMEDSLTERFERCRSLKPAP